MSFFKKLRRSILIGGVMISMLVPSSVYAASYHAYNAYITPTNQVDSDILSADWMTYTTAKHTYWSVYNWSASKGADTSGYAGFQDTDDGHKSIISLWTSNENGESASSVKEKISVMYQSKKYKAKINVFDNEGSGLNCIASYPWKTNNWYRMVVKSWTKGQDTYIGQWIYDVSARKWDIMVVFRINGKPHQEFGSITGFQEDYGSAIDGYRDGCFKNYEQRQASNKVWRVLNQAEVYIPSWCAANQVGDAWVQCANEEFFKVATTDGDYKNTPDFSKNKYKLKPEYVNQDKFKFTIKSSYESDKRVRTVATLSPDSTPFYKISDVRVENAQKKYMCGYGELEIKGDNIYECAQSYQKQLSKGTYKVIYKAEDIFGKTTTVETNFTVK